MFDSVLADLTNRRSNKPRAATLPWQGVVLFLCLVIVPVAAAVVYRKCLLCLYSSSDPRLNGGSDDDETTGANCARPGGSVQSKEVTRGGA